MGCVHIYCGDGKGKTTAAAGLAARMQGCGGHVVAARFLKTDDSGEVRALKSLPGIEILPCDRNFGFTWQMTESQREEASGYYGDMFEQACKRALELCESLKSRGREEKRGEGPGRDCQTLLILDEIFAACRNGFVQEKKVVDFLHNRPCNLEVVMTGRDPSEKLLQEADYVSEIVCRRHPFEMGVTARRGIEY